jgi:hypothetical protein
MKWEGVRGERRNENGFGWIEKRKEIAITKSAEFKPCQYLLGWGCELKKGKVPGEVGNVLAEGKIIFFLSNFVLFWPYLIEPDFSILSLDLATWI